jgi:hypothetical protein
VAIAAARVDHPEAGAIRIVVVVVIVVVAIVVVVIGAGMVG